MRTLKFLPQIRLEVWLTNLLNLVLITRKSIILCVCFFRPNRKEICDCYRLPPFAGNIFSFYGFEEAELGRESRVIRNTVGTYNPVKIVPTIPISDGFGSLAWIQMQGPTANVPYHFNNVGIELTKHFTREFWNFLSRVSFWQCSGSAGSLCFWATRDPDPLVTSTDPDLALDPDPSLLLPFTLCQRPKPWCQWPAVAMVVKV